MTTEHNLGWPCRWSPFLEHGSFYETRTLPLCEICFVLYFATTGYFFKSSVGRSTQTSYKSANVRGIWTVVCVVDKGASTGYEICR
jgi:hypothetical protein